MANLASAEAHVPLEPAWQELDFHDLDEEGSIRDQTENTASLSELVPVSHRVTYSWATVSRRAIRYSGALVVFIVACVGLWAGAQPLFRLASQPHGKIRSAATDIITEDSLVSLVPNTDSNDDAIHVDEEEDTVASSPLPSETPSPELTSALPSSSSEEPLSSSPAAPFSSEAPSTSSFSQPPPTIPAVTEMMTTTTEMCHTAEEGEPCYDDVFWAMTEGINIHPEWYPGLGTDSSIEAFQSIVHASANSGGKCPPPCDGYTVIKQTTTTPRPWGYPSLFCFSVAMVNTYEMENIRQQRAKGAGIFACEDQAVLSQEKFILGGGLSTLVFKGATVGRSKDGTAANSQIFINVWKRIFEDRRYADYHFTVKMDPDAVIVPNRLRPRVEPYVSTPVFFENCNKVPGSPDFPMMFGAMEVLSAEAVEAYVPKIKKCKWWFPTWNQWGEDFFMGKCLQKLKVKAIWDFGMLQDDRCLGVDCSNQDAAGFHEFKSVGAYFACLDKTMTPPPPMNKTRRLS